jgi:hypothetical protein
MTTRFRFEVFQNVQKLMGQNIVPVARAATLAMQDAAEQAKKQGKASIAAAGFSLRWQEALKAKVYPQKGFSVNAAAWIYHKIPYSDVFENGATITGKPFMWLPLPAAKAFKGFRGGRVTPKAFIRQGRSLYTVKRAGKPPIMFGSVGRGKRMPLFIGIAIVNIRARFKVEQAAKAAAAQLPRFYLSNFKDDV